MTLSEALEMCEDMCCMDSEDVCLTANADGSYSLPWEVDQG